MQFPEIPFGDAAASPVLFHFEEVSFELPDEQALTEWLRLVAQLERKNFQEVSYIFCSDEYLRRLNVEHLAHDYYTDVITFPYSDTEIYGDVFISVERVEDHARQHGVSFFHELCRVMVHGVLHLAGYGDKTPEQALLMREKEDFYLQKAPLPS